ncbi:hypothetical protein SDC9_65905 [bioreactor metagenome]|uniref:Uncharacterized protein n=1 Tax=bioreactor metagenome TaxID=1076179 RepID=A0A644XUQ8_9ZZZZ
MPIFFISGLAALFMILIKNSLLSPLKIKKFILLQRVLFFSCIFIGIWYDVYYYRNINSLLSLSQMYSIIVCSTFFVTDGIWLLKNKEDLQAMKYVLKNALGYLALLLALNAVALMMESGHF